MRFVLFCSCAAAALASCSSLDTPRYAASEALAFSPPSATASARAPSAQGGTGEVYSTAKRGDWEILLGASGSNNQDFDAGGFSLAGSVGYFLNENWELLVRQDGGYSDFGNSTWSASTRVAIDYHFLDGNWRPYVGANLGRVYGDAVDDTFAAAPELGLKWYVRRNVFFNVLAEYQFFFEDGDSIDDQFEDGSFVYSLGIGLRL